MVATEFMAASGRPVDPEQVYGSHPHLVAKDVADAILYSLGVPQHVQVRLTSTCKAQRTYTRSTHSQLNPVHTVTVFSPSTIPPNLTPLS